MAKSTYTVQFVIDGQPTFERPLDEILGELGIGDAIEILTQEEYLGLQQVRWWKGVLLPTLARETGDTVGVWETRLKLAVLPDDFRPEIVVEGGQEYATIASISKLGKRKMNELIEGSIAQLHEWGFAWATLPDTSLRKT